MNVRKQARFGRSVFRVGSNYVRLFSTFLMGLLLVRLLLQFGHDAFALIILLGAGTGLATMLKEVVRASMVPELGAAYHSKDKSCFPSTYNAAVLLSLGGAFLTVCAFGVSILFLPLLNIPREMFGAASIFMIAKAVQMLFVVGLAPTFNMYVVSERMVSYNFWTVVERVGEVLSAICLLALGIHSDPATAVIYYGILSSVFGVVTVFASCLILIAVDTRFLPTPWMATAGAAISLIRSMGWNCIVVVSMNLYVRVDMVIMNVAFGLMGNLAFGIACQLTSYVRMLAMGLVTGMDAVAARLANDADKRAVKLFLIRSSRLQGLVVFPATLVLLVFTKPLISVWIGDRIDDPESSISAVVLLSRIMIVGIAMRSLSEGWMRVLSGAGKVSCYAPALLMGAIANPFLAVSAIHFFPEAVSFTAPACVFSVLTTIVHLGVLPVIVARQLDCSLREVLAPLLRPLLATGITTAFLMLLPGNAQGTRTELLVLAGVGLCTYVLVAAGIAISAAHFRPVLRLAHQLTSRFGTRTAENRRQMMLFRVFEMFLSRLPLAGFMIPTFFIEIIARGGGLLCGVVMPDRTFVAERRIRGLMSAARFRATGLRLDRGIRFEGTCIALESNVTLYGGSHYVAGGSGSVKIGERTHLGRNCVVSGLGGIEIGRGCAISSSVTMYSNTNHYRSAPCIPILENETIYGKVTIGDDVWIGAGAVILPGVSVGDHAVIGAGAVVTRDVEPWLVVVGVPARVLKDRRQLSAVPSSCSEAA